VGSLSVTGIERRLTSDSRAAGEAHDAQLEVVDGSSLGVARLLAPAEGRVVVTIGSPARRVMPCGLDDRQQEVIAVNSIIEVWVHGGGTLSVIETADLAGRFSFPWRAMSPRGCADRPVRAWRPA
jgi:hypothetical protein